MRRAVLTKTFRNLIFFWGGAFLFFFAATHRSGTRPSRDTHPYDTCDQLKLKLADINQNPFRHSLLDSVTSGDESSSSGDISEDMSWGFDQTFFGEEGDGDGGGEPDDYDDI